MMILYNGILEELVDQLRLAYADPKAVEQVTRKLQTMKQGTLSFALYVAEFERTLLDADGGD
jgi:hypothetical protein